MKVILLACGSGIATSTAVARRVAKLLDDHGFGGTYRIEQCAVTEAAARSHSADILVSTTIRPDGVECPYLSGIPFLTGQGRDAAARELLELMAE